MAREGTEDQVMEKSVIIGREIYESSQVYSHVLTFKLLHSCFPGIPFFARSCSPSSGLQ